MAFTRPKLPTPSQQRQFAISIFPPSRLPKHSKNAKNCHKKKQKHQSAASLGWQVQSIGQSAGTNKRPRTDKTKHKLILAVPVITSSGQVKGLGQLIGGKQQTDQSVHSSHRPLLVTSRPSDSDADCYWSSWVAHKSLDWAKSCQKAIN